MHVTRGILDKKTGEVVGREEFYVEKDECNRADTTLEGLMSLPPVFDKESGQGSVTAGNSSQLSDGASATLVMSSDRARALGIRPKLVFRGFADRRLRARRDGHSARSSRSRSSSGATASRSPISTSGS